MALYTKFLRLLHVEYEDRGVVGFQMLARKKCWARILFIVLTSVTETSCPLFSCTRPPFLIDLTFFVYFVRWSSFV